MVSVVIHVAAPRDDIDDSVATLRQSLVIAVPVAAAVLALLTWVLVGRTLRPVERIRAEVAGIGGAGKKLLDRRVPVPAGDDEISRLATTMNDMLARVEQAQARQRRFVADASHELRSPMTRMRTEWRSTSPIRTPLTRRRLNAACWRRLSGCEQLVDDLLVLARSNGAAVAARGDERFDLGDVSMRAAERSRPREGVTVVVDATAEAPYELRGAAWRSRAGYQQRDRQRRPPRLGCRARWRAR